MPTIALLWLVLVVLLVAGFATWRGTKTRRFLLPGLVAVAGLGVGLVVASGYVFSHMWPDGPTDATEVSVYFRSAGVLIVASLPFFLLSAFLAWLTYRRR
jgi:hypothetical protein